MGGAPRRSRPQWLVHPRTRNWRWWSGHHWTQYTVAVPRRPLLPPFLSVPVVVFLAAEVTFALAYGFDVLLLAAAAVPSLAVLAFLLFLDRVEPEPAEGRWHALLWGMLVAGFVAAVVNDAVASSLGEAAALLVAAPLGEELLKGAGILWAVRRGEIDDALDGAIYAGWVAVGFTVAEDYVYLLAGSDDGLLVETLFSRGIGTFAHPLFTVWIGIAVGRAVSARTGLRGPFLRSLAVAVALHAAWNLATVLPIFWGVYVLFLALAGYTVVHLRRHERDFRHDVNGSAQLIASAASTSPLSPTSLRTLERATDPLLVAALRSPLGRRARRALDAERTAIVRLLLRARRAGIVYPAEILELSDHLAEIERLAASARPSARPTARPSARAAPPPPPPTGRPAGGGPAGSGPAAPREGVDPFD